MTDAKDTSHRGGQKRNLAIDNPCVKEMQLSLKCIERHYSEQSKCQGFFDNYKACKAFWDRVTRDRSIKGIRPYLPAIEERDRVMEEYKKLWGY